MSNKRSYAITNISELSVFFKETEERFIAYGAISIDVTQLSKQRSLSQNKSLHLYCEQISEGMNDAGFTQRQLLVKFKEGFELPVTMEMIKAIFRSVGEAMYEKESTADLSTVEIQKVYQAVDQRFGEITGIRKEWPSVDSFINKSVDNN